MNIVKSQHVNAGIIKPGSRNKEIVWELFPGAFGQIEFVKATCGCTTPTWDSNRILAKYNDSTNEKNIENSPNKAMLVTKNLKIYLN